MGAVRVQVDHTVKPMDLSVKAVKTSYLLHLVKDGGDTPALITQKNSEKKI